MIETITKRNINIDIMNPDGILIGQMRIPPENRYFDGVRDGKKIVRVSQLRATVIDRRPTLKGREFEIMQNGEYYCFKYE